MQAPVIFICLVVATLSIAESASPYQHAATIESDSLFVLSNGIITARITKKTAAVVSLFVPSCLSVEPLDIALGYENTTGYLLNPHPNFNSIVGRVANRISGARFSIPRTGPSDKQKTYYLEANDGNNTLHSGSTGYSYQTFTAPRGVQVDPDGVRLELLFYSPNGQGGFPGNVASRVQYFLPNGEPELQVLMTSVASQTTPINVIYHNYFNLNGPGNKSTILNHNFTIHANLYAPLDAENIPTGELLPVKGTYLDFTSSRQATWSQQNWPAGKSFGYDNMYSLLRPSALSKTPPISLINPLINPQVVTFSSLGSPLAIAAEASSPITGINMTMWTDAPSLQFYTSNFLTGNAQGQAGPGKGGVYYPQFGGFSLESQAFVNSVNQPNFPSTLVSPKEVFQHQVRYKFGCLFKAK